MQSLSSVEAPLAGGCLCGQVTYVCSKQPVWSANCHCRSCQMLSGAPYVSAFSVPANGFSLVGSTFSVERQSDSADAVTTFHCVTCGSRLCAQSAGAAHLMNVFAATLAPPSRYVPISNVFLNKAAHLDHASKGTLHLSEKCLAARWCGKADR